LSIPDGASQKSEDKSIIVEVPRSFEPPKHDFKIYYKTDAMQRPTLVFEENPAYPDEVAVAAILPYSVEMNP
jgi:hypothetical protein